MAFPLTTFGDWRTKRARPGDLPCHGIRRGRLGELSPDEPTSAKNAHNPQAARAESMSEGGDPRQPPGRRPWPE